FIAAAVLAALWWRARAMLREAVLGRAAAVQSRDAVAGILGTLPLAAFRWRPDGSVGSTLGASPGGAGLTYAGFLAGLETEDAARITAALDHLKRTGTAFTAAVSAPGGAAYEIEGRRTGSGESVMWLIDTSALRHAEEA